MGLSINQRRLGIGLALAALVLLALAVFAPSLYEVVDRGRGIVPYENVGVVYKVQILDSFNFYADSESRPDPDKLSSAGLVAAATMTLMTALLLHAVGAGARLRRFYAYATAGLALLAADELFALHETIGHNLQFLADLPGVQRPDDAVFLLYGVAAAIFAWVFRDVFFSHRRAMRLFAVGIGFYAIAAMGDVVGSGVEEPAEIAAAVCLVTGFVMMTAAVLRRELGLGLAPEVPRAEPQRRATWTTHTVRARPR
jgi:hypothetical protein